MRRCEEVLAYAKDYGGVVTLLWHQVSMAAPKRWGEFYRVLVERAIEDGAWVTNINDLLLFSRCRRTIGLSLIFSEGNYSLKIKDYEETKLSLSFRIYSCSDDKEDDNYVEVKCTSGCLEI